MSNQQDNTSKLQSFSNRCMRQIISIHHNVRNSSAILTCGKKRSNNQWRLEMRKRTWRRIGQTLRKPRQCMTRHSLIRNPQGRKARRRPRMT
ncbi:hypothetical protein ElyMa_000126900 [Elysia marginata]|uniref:Uncharacterized protein n=1 Tax=Elysia marginata TaxID=1093978 RepID=A0AAV4ENX1_9GAST|nr:hypothetical protein ElyMa_000126900 [Elysia marginata]